jgi:hypothetical protein
MIEVREFHRGLASTGFRAGDWIGLVIQRGNRWRVSISPPHGTGRWSDFRVKREAAERLASRKLKEALAMAAKDGKEIVRAMKAGERLCKTFRSVDGCGSEPTYHLDPSGRLCAPVAALCAIESGEIEPCGDGLFGAENSQSWVAKGG